MTPQYCHHSCFHSVDIKRGVLDSLCRPSLSFFVHTIIRWYRKRGRCSVSRHSFMKPIPCGEVVSTVRPQTSFWRLSLQLHLCGPSIATVSFKPFAILSIRLPPRAKSRFSNATFYTTKKNLPCFGYSRQTCSPRQSSVKKEAFMLVPSTVDLVSTSFEPRVIIFPPYVASNDANTVKSQLHRQTILLEANLAHSEGRRPSSSHMQALAAMKSTAGVQKSIYAMKSESGKLVNRALAGGNHCDCCKKSTQELNLDSLLKCGRCQMVFYCSADCQRMSWNSEHKRDCRKKGQIEVGDDMMLDRLSSRPDLNGRFVKVIGRGKTEGKWLVRLGDTTQPMSVSADKLVRLRPASV